jgi:hypothetical protein
MTLDDMILAEAEKARDRMEAAQDEVERARADYHRAVRRLHSAGGTLREIAEVLGLSHQRVHQVVDSGSMIDPEPPAKKSGGLVHCTFCNTSQKNTKKLIAGPGVYICEVCVAGAVALGSGNDPPDLRAPLGTVPATLERARCAFCGKKRTKVDWFVAAVLNDVRICNECVALCVEIIGEEL